MPEPVRAEDIMVRDLKTAGPETDLQTIACLMRDQNVGIVPIVDLEQGVLGVVTDRDLVVGPAARGVPLKDIAARN